MVVELIPVIEIDYSNQEVTLPDKYPYWENSQVWYEYHDECNKRAGFKDKLNPYLKGSCFYRLTDITDNNLKKLTIDHTQDSKDRSCPFFGGYVLRINGQDKLFPQCCGLLADINFWGKISNGQRSSYEGHPAPNIKIKKNKIAFDFSTEKNEETFQPTPPEKRIQIERISLQGAVENVKQDLEFFAERLLRINVFEHLNINKIDDVLIWYDANY